MTFRFADLRRPRSLAAAGIVAWLAAGCAAEPAFGPETAPSGEDAGELGTSTAAATADDSLDDSFGGDGRVNVGDAVAFLPVSVAATADHKVVYTGRISGADMVCKIGRTTANGNEDPAWNGGQPFLLSFYYNKPCQIGDALPAGDHTWVVGGFKDARRWPGFLVRMRDDGQPDTTFGERGALLLDAPGLENMALSRLSRDASGRLVAAGLGYKGGDYYLVLVRFDARGRVDGSFGTNGFVNLKLPEAAQSVGPGFIQLHLAIGAGRRDIHVLEEASRRVFHFSAEGVLDRAYEGAVTGSAADLAVTRTGIAYVPIMEPGEYRVAAFDGRGARLRGFGAANDGVARFSVWGLWGARSIAYSESLQRLYVLGSGEMLDGPDGFAVAALRPDGRPDVSFNGDGHVLTTFGRQNRYGLVLTLDGTRLLAAGGVADAEVRGMVMAAYKIGSGKARQPCRDDRCAEGFRCESGTSSGASISVDSCKAVPAPRPDPVPEPEPVPDPRPTPEPACPGRTISPCGIGCPEGYHPTSFTSSFNCPSTGSPSATVSNSTTCARDCGDRFVMCGFVCPTGYFVESSTSSFACRVDKTAEGNNPNSVQCVKL